MESFNSSLTYTDYETTDYYESDFGVTTDEQKKPSHDGKDIARVLTVVIYSLTCLLGILGNGVVILTIILKMKRSVNAIWFLNLAVADFLFNIFLPLNITYTAMNYNWVFGLALCKINSFLLNLNLYSSVLLLTMISFDRWMSVVFPVWAQNHRTITRARLICVVVWFVSFLVSCPSLIFRQTAFYKDKVICFSNFSSRNDSVNRHSVVNIIKFLTGFAIPVIFIMVCYMTIFYKLKRNRLTKSKKPFKIIVTIIVTFFLCWTPYHVLNLLEVQHAHISRVVFEIAIPFVTALAAVSSCINPILYVFMGQDFKKFKVSVLSRVVNALSEDNIHSGLGQKSFSKMSSVTEKETMMP